MMSVILPEKGRPRARKDKQPEVYIPAEQAALAREFSPALVDDLDPSLLLRLRQLGDSGLRQAMQFLSKDE
jgi:hypothetical protein